MVALPPFALSMIRFPVYVPTVSPSTLGVTAMMSPSMLTFSHEAEFGSTDSGPRSANGPIALDARAVCVAKGTPTSVAKVSVSVDTTSRAGGGVTVKVTPNVAVPPFVLDTATLPW